MNVMTIYKKRFQWKSLGGGSIPLTGQYEKLWFLKSSILMPLYSYCQLWRCYNNQRKKNQGTRSLEAFRIQAKRLWCCVWFSWRLSFADGGSGDEQAGDHGRPVAHLPADCQGRPRCLWGHHAFSSFILHFLFLLSFWSLTSQQTHCLWGHFSSNLNNFFQSQHFIRSHLLKSVFL